MNKQKQNILGCCWRRQRDEPLGLRHGPWQEEEEGCCPTTGTANGPTTGTANGTTTGNGRGPPISCRARRLRSRAFEGTHREEQTIDGQAAENLNFSFFFFFLVSFSPFTFDVKKL